MITRALRWWDRHPWLSWWIAVLAACVFIVLAVPARAPTGSIPVIALLWLLFVVGTFLHGVAVFWRKSKRAGRADRRDVARRRRRAALRRHGRSRESRQSKRRRSLADERGQPVRHAHGAPARVARGHHEAVDERARRDERRVPPCGSGPSGGWTPYEYRTGANGHFSISATGDNTTARVP